MDTTIYTTGRLGECDRCHDDRDELFFIEDDEPGEWEYCHPCAVKVAAFYERKAAKARARA